MTAHCRGRWARPKRSSTSPLPDSERAELGGGAGSGIGSFDGLAMRAIERIDSIQDRRRKPGGLQKLFGSSQVRFFVVLADFLVHIVAVNGAGDAGQACDRPLVALNAD